ncbi:class F sortase [Tomitella gaofuii]|uniref:class F sortase n=1 Tax=Tomitella gaofuii TaxID=2760083 RepID=UPI0020BFCC13|nr:class F sortase [Tomitella gaofuii]
MRHVTQSQAGRRRRVCALVAAVVLAVGGIAAIVIGLRLQQSPPQPPAAAAAAQPAPPPGPSADGAGAGPAPAAGPVLPHSVPTRIDIPAIDVHHTLITLGQNPDGSVQVPSLDDVAVPGWARFSPTPGEQGPAVIVGHVDSAEQGKGVFFRLGDLRPGDMFTVGRADGTVAEFTITGVDRYAKDAFPTLAVYGNTRRAEARLITCGGSFDPDTGNYTDNIVAYARLTGSHPVPAP